MKFKGQNLVETLIIFAVAIVGALLVLTILGSNVQNMYQTAVNKAAGFKLFGNPTTTATTTATTATATTGTKGPLGGTSDNPQYQCNAGNCTIDYGEFVLNGIPESFGEFVESSGTSGGTDELFNLIDQIANQLEQNGDIEGAEEYRKLSNLGHLQADFSKDIETAFNNCNTKVNLISGVSNCLEFQFSTRITVPANIQELVPDFSNTSGIFWLSRYNEGARLDYAMYEKLNNPTMYDRYKTQYPSYAMVDIFQSIMNNPKYSAAQKSVTQKLYQNISDLLINSSVTIATITRNTQYDYQKFDPITGAYIETMPPPSLAGGIADVLQPKTSLKTDIRSALICVTGKNYDNGDECKK